MTEETTNAPRRAIQRQVTAQVKRQKTTIDVDPTRVLPEFFAISGVLGQDPELRFTPSGRAVCTLNVAHEIRNRVTEPGKPPRFVTEGTMWIRCIVWGDQAENVAESLTRGMRVIAFGEWSERDYDAKDDDGNDVKRTIVEFTAREIGASLLFTAVHVPSKAEREQVSAQG